MLSGVLVLKQKNICEVKEMALVKKENMTDIAYACLVKHSGEVAFKTLWQEVAQMMAIPEELQSRKKSQFYSELMLDNRFASLKGNMWDIRNRRKYEEVHSSQSIIDEFENDTDDIDEEEETYETVKNEEEY